MAKDKSKPVLFFLNAPDKRRGGYVSALSYSSKYQGAQGAFRVDKDPIMSGDFWEWAYKAINAGYGQPSEKADVLEFNGVRLECRDDGVHITDLLAPLEEPEDNA